MKELCTTIGLPIKGGKQQKLITATIDRYFEYTKEGRKVTVTKILEEPMPKPTRKDNLWIDPLIIALLRSLIDITPIDRESDKTYHAYISNYELALCLGICNDYFHFARLEHNKLDVKDGITADFFSAASKRFWYVASVCKASLTSRKIVTNRTVWRYYLKEDSQRVNILEADDNLAAKIDERFKKTMLEYGFKDVNKFALLKSRKVSDFYTTFNRRLYCELGIIGAHETIKFSFTKYIFTQLDTLYADLENVEVKSIVNKDICMFLAEKSEEYIKHKMILQVYKAKPLAEQKDYIRLQYEELINEFIKLSPEYSNINFDNFNNQQEPI